MADPGSRLYELRLPAVTDARVRDQVARVLDRRIPAGTGASRGEALGDALTLVAPNEEGDLRTIERAIGTRITRATLPDFDYSQRQSERLEIPLAERLAAMRAQRAGQRRGASGGRRHAPAGSSARAAR